MRPKRSSLNRRQFFARSAVAAGATSLGGGLFDALVARSAYAGEPQAEAALGLATVLCGRPATTSRLPAGFQYRVISNEGDPMDDGFPTPKAMDGMAAFAGPNGNILLVRNHEDGQAGNTLRPRPAGQHVDAARAFSPTASRRITARAPLRSTPMPPAEPRRSKSSRTASAASSASTGASSARCAIAPEG